MKTNVFYFSTTDNAIFYRLCNICTCFMSFLCNMHPYLTMSANIHYGLLNSFWLKLQGSSLALLALLISAEMFLYVLREFAFVTVIAVFISPAVAAATVQTFSWCKDKIWTWFLADCSLKISAKSKVTGQQQNVAFKFYRNSEDLKSCKKTDHSDWLLTFVSCKNYSSAMFERVNTVIVWKYHSQFILSACLI